MPKKVMRRIEKVVTDYEIKIAPEENEFEIEIKQYLRPNGEIRMLSGILPIEYKSCYNNMKQKGFELVTEELTTGEVVSYISTCTWSYSEYDLMSSITPNNEEVREAVCKMLLGFEDAFNANGN